MSSSAPPASSGGPKIWGGVPMRNVHFTGREDVLARLRQDLTTDKGALVLYALKGLGGIGKTQTATEYAHRFMDDYDVVWWIPGGGKDPLTVRSSLISLAARLGIAGTGGDLAGSTAVPELLDALRRGEPYRRWLLVYDNVDEPDAIAPLLPSGPGHVLITSRDDRWRHGVHTMDIDVFERAESVAFLRRRIDGITEADADRVAEEVGDLPLALEQAAALMTEAGLSADDFIRQLPQHLGEDFRPVGYPMSVDTVWSMSVARLQVQSPDAVELLSRCAHLGPTPIPLALFTEGRQVLDGPFGRILDDPARFQRALRSLGRFSLARVETVHRTMTIHRLVQRTQRRAADPETAERHRRDVHLLLSARVPSDPDNIDNWPIFSRLLGHVVGSGAQTSDVPLVRQMCVNVAYYLVRRGDYDGARRFVTEALDHWTGGRGDADAPPSGADRDEMTRWRLVLVMQRILALTSRLLGDVATAYELNRRTLERMRQALEPDDEQTLLTMNAHAADLRWRGEFAEAMALDEESYRLHQSVFGPLEAPTLMSANNMAVDLRLTGDYDRALALDEDTSARRLNVHGRSDNPWVLNSRNNVNRDLRECGRYAESLEAQRRVCADYRMVLPLDSHYVLRAEKNLSVSMRKAGSYEESLALGEELRARYQERYGLEHPDTMAASCNLINEWRLAGRIDEALELGEETLRLYRRVLGEKHPFVFGCAINVAVVLRLSGRPEEAAAMNETTRRELGALVGDDHPHPLLATVNLASDRAALGDPAAAVGLGEATTPLLARRRGAEHPDTLACAANLGIDLEAAGFPERGAELLLDTVRRLRDTLGTEHPLAVSAAQGDRIDCDFEPQPL